MMIIIIVITRLIIVVLSNVEEIKIKLFKNFKITFMWIPVWRSGFEEKYLFIISDGLSCHFSSECANFFQIQPY